MFVCLEIESSAFWGGLSACPANPGQVKADTLTHDLTHSKADRQQQGTHTDCQTFKTGDTSFSIRGPSHKISY